MTHRRSGLVAALFLTFSANWAHAQLDKPVKTTSGLVQGVPGITPGFEVFKGIPYAAPPIGDLRWRPPAVPSPWRGVRAADKFSADCSSLGPIPESTATGTSEDCLYLNLWTPARTPHDGLPVMVWIYGGAFVGGSPTYPRYDGDGLNRKGVILVSMNYRSGVLGFLSHPLLTAESPHHASGNYGVLDALETLKWVKSNIAQFGGDPNRVTLFGQSSGSQTVNLLTVSPLAKGLFQRVIGESGAGFGERQPKGLSEAERFGEHYAMQFGGTLAELRAKSPAELLAAAKRGDFEPIVDGWLLPADSYRLLTAGRQNDVPTLLGSNADESQLSPKTTRASYEAQIRGQYGSHADAMLLRFPTATDEQAPLVQKTFNTLVLGDFNVGSWANGQMKKGKSSVFQYRFTHVPPPFAVPGAPPGPVSAGASHGAEIPFAFNNLDRQNRAWTDDDRRVAELTSSYWTNFAKTGNPNGPGLPIWTSLNADPAKVLEIGDTTQMIDKPNKQDMQFIETIFYGADGIFASSPK